MAGRLGGPPHSSPAVCRVASVAHVLHALGELAPLSCMPMPGRRLGSSQTWYPNAKDCEVDTGTDTGSLPAKDCANIAKSPNSHVCSRCVSFCQHGNG